MIRSLPGDRRNSLVNIDRMIYGVAMLGQIQMLTLPQVSESIRNDLIWSLRKLFDSQWQYQNNEGKMELCLWLVKSSEVNYRKLLTWLQMTCQRWEIKVHSFGHSNGPQTYDLKIFYLTWNICTEKEAFQNFLYRLTMRRSWPVHDLSSSI